MKVLAPNTLLQNRYLVVHLIGKGGMGEVYLAVDQRLGSAVALKRTFFAENETLGNAFEREARILGRLRHPVLPKVSDHFIENDNQYLIMEHISGDDLAKRLELTQKPFPLSWVLFWGDQLLDALSYLHSHEPPIIHRDIKPQNLKLTDENNIILLDFGLSKSSIGDSRLSSPVNSNASGSVVGYTPHYAPMEQIRGTGTSPRSDIYSLSTTLYQLLTNTVPPDALTRADSLLNGSPDPVQPINELNSEVSKAVSDVIIKGMSVSQDLRYANAREMQKELRDAYARMQKDMSAQTIALSASDPAASAVTNTGTSFTGQSQPKNLNEDIRANNPSVESGISSSQPQNPPPDFEATLRYDGEPQAFHTKQSDVKTEVFSGGIFPIATEPEPPPFENYSPDVTMPINSFTPLAGQNDSVTGNSMPTNDEHSDAAVPATAMFVPGKYPAENFSQTDNYTAGDNFSSLPEQTAGEKHTSAAPYRSDQYNSQANQSAAPAAASAAAPSAAIPAKSGNGKLLAVVGVLGLLLFLGIGAAGLGYWYLYAGRTTTEATPTPVPSVSPTPTPQEILVESNSQTNSGGSNSSTNSNSNISTELTNTDSNTNSTTVSNSTTVTTKTPVTTTTATPKPQTTQTTQTTRVTPTPKKTDSSTAGTTKVTPVKTPKKDDSTKILQ